MFPMIRFFFHRWSPFTTYRFPYALYSWFTPFCLMIKDMFHWLFKGYPTCFVWDTDVTIAQFSIPLLKKLRDTKDGTPGKVFTECYIRDDLEMSEEDRAVAFEKAHQEWIKIVDKIIYALDGVVKGSPDELFIQYYRKDWKLACKLKHEEQKKINEGIELFGKYFQCLWD